MLNANNSQLGNHMQKTLDQQFTTALHRCHLKVTPARRAIFEILCRAERPLLPREIVEQAGTVDQSSVYRNLPLLARHRIARKVSQGFKTLYELGDNFTNHQHYVICQQCGRSVKIDSPPLESLVHRLTLAAGMEPTGHFIELTGLCRQCRREAGRSAGPNCEYCCQK
jgi:Fe2+ or Zn2+ uptake regulation protein